MVIAIKSITQDTTTANAHTRNHFWFFFIANLTSVYR